MARTFTGIPKTRRRTIAARNEAQNNTYRIQASDIPPVPVCIPGKDHSFHEMAIFLFRHIYRRGTTLEYKVIIMAKENKGRAAAASFTYTLASIIQWLRYAAMFGIIVYLVYSENILELETWKIGIAAALEVFLFAIGKPLDKVRYKAREEFSYGEDGMSKKYSSYQTLSRKEREAMDKERIADAERILSSGEIAKMTKRGSHDPAKDLEKLIGLPKVKNQILEMSARMEFDKKRKRHKAPGSENISSMHMLFIGNPGTGKTTVARIMAGFLYKNGYIRQNSYIETDGNTLRGNAAGETSKRTEMILSKAKGKLLFIDEAYAMFSGPDSQEAIATIVKTMENERDSFVLILAGYKNEMKRLIDANSGFASRFGYVVDFPDYSTQELCDIFTRMAHDNGMYVPAETLERFETRIEKERKLKNFGNARTCRNILDKALSSHALNLKRGTIDAKQTYTLCPEDISLESAGYQSLV